MTAFNFTTKQEGYGRQGLYFSFNGEKYFIQSVFPNVPEYFEDYELSEDCFYDEETETYRDSNGHEVTPIDSWDEFLTNNYKEEIGQILFENLDFDDYEFDFDNSTSEEIAEWASNY
jgi:hypothetical protein